MCSIMTDKNNGGSPVSISDTITIMYVVNSRSIEGMGYAELIANSPTTTTVSCQS
jgi:hypothetical protein